MDVLTAIANRRTTKQYDTCYIVEEGLVDKLMEAAMLAPTSYNIQHGRIVRVTDPARRAALREAAFDQAQVTDASELWVICADVQAWRKSPRRYWRNVADGTRDFLVDMMTGFYQGRPALQRDEAIRTGAFMAQNIMIAATSLGLNSGPMIGFEADRVAEIIDLPDDHVIVMMLTIGKATAPAWPRGGALPRKEVLRENHF